MMADAWASALGAVSLAEARNLAVREGLAARLIARDGAMAQPGPFRDALTGRLRRTACAR
jgi:thiamine biosynthesis lipoprotein ApbE